MQTSSFLKVTQPSILVVFGVTGDLSQRKLLPALWDLYVKGALPEKFHIVGFSRRDWNDEEFQEYVKNVIAQAKGKVDKALLSEFLRTLSYQEGLFDESSQYTELQKHITQIDVNFSQCSNKLFYRCLKSR